jgi:hypothetical protein
MKKLICYAAFILLIMSGCALWKMSAPVREKEELIFSHKKHLEMDAECEMCHTEVSESTLASSNNYPKEENCLECHEREDCSLCHLNVDNAVPLVPPPTGLIFPHKDHLDSAVKNQSAARRTRAEAINKIVPFVKEGSLEKQIDCMTCHESAEESEKATDNLKPKMKTCLKCHEVTGENCTLCHSDLGERDFVPASHYFAWLLGHQQMASIEGESLCGNCHRGEVRPTEGAVFAVTEDHVREEDARLCAECHRGDIWPEGVHDNNRIQTHGADALANQTVCNSCHQREECLACHESRGIPFSEVHEVGWQFDHAEKARRQLSACAACHREEDCLGCHQTVSPHPSDWDMDITDRNEHLCSKCHTN